MTVATKPKERSSESLPESLPPLTPDTVQRAREGWEAAIDREVRQATEEAFDITQEIGLGKPPRRANGHLRRWILRWLVRLLFRVKVENAHLLPEGPVLLVANHLNHIDPLLILGEIPASPYCYVLGDARSLYNAPWKRAILQWAQGVIPLNRWWKEEKAVIAGAKSGREDLAELAEKIQQDVPDGSSIEMLRQLDRSVQAVFNNGDSLLLFPEGKLGTEEGKLLPLKRGVATYALRSGVPIVPIALIGTEDLYFRKTLTLRFGEAIAVPQAKRPKSRQVQAVIEAVRERLEALLPPDYREPDELKLFGSFLNHMFW
ncbi:lysophospholipid acyltransferase family protein [Baaleninema sp.]|uniref:lysophospholipid acyltransferase family protein n=1 Tax=Baaleninema sp. TaxID=3101197 RepID=UPI003D0392CA